MQSTARRNDLPLDKMCLQCDVTKKQKEEFTWVPLPLPRQFSIDSWGDPFPGMLTIMSNLKFAIVADSKKSKNIAILSKR